MRRIAILSALLCACARAGVPALAPALSFVPPVTSRPFRMGFTTAPGGPSNGEPNGLARTIRFIRENADIIVVHRDGPHVPWRALANGNVGRFRRDLARQRVRLGTGLPLYMLITPLNIFRNGIGGDWPGSLGPACVSNPQLRLAFEQYARVVVETMQPDYLGLGSEVNIYETAAPKDCPNDFDALVSLYKETYHIVKAMRPDLPVFVTFQLEFLHINHQQLLPARFLPELDRLAISLYPSGNLTRMRPSDIPPDYISWARASTDAPLVIAETGYGSASAGGSIGSPELQQEYLQWLLTEAAREDAQFVTWFFSTDPRYVKVPPGLDYINAFRSMGLVTPRFKPKPAFDVWRAWFALPLVTTPAQARDAP